MFSSRNRASMPNVRASSGMIGTTRGPMCSSRHRPRSSRVKPIVVDTACPFDPPRSSANALSPGSSILRRATVRALGDRAVERLAPLHHVLVLDRVLRQLDVRRVLLVDRVLGDRVVQVQPVAQIEQLLLGHLLDLVRRVAALEARAERPALDRLAQDDRRAARPEVLRGRLVRRVELAVVVAAAGQVDEVVVGAGATPSGAAARRVRRSCRGCTRRSRCRTAGTGRRRSCSSG